MPSRHWEEKPTSFCYERHLEAKVVFASKCKGFTAVSFFILFVSFCLIRRNMLLGPDGLCQSVIQVMMHPFCISQVTVMTTSPSSRPPTRWTNFVSLTTLHRTLSPPQGRHLYRHRHRSQTAAPPLAMPPAANTRVSFCRRTLNCGSRTSRAAVPVCGAAGGWQRGSASDPPTRRRQGRVFQTQPTAGR